MDETRLTIEIDKEKKDKFRQKLASINIGLTMKEKILKWIDKFLRGELE